MQYPMQPKHRNQRYFLTEKGSVLRGYTPQVIPQETPEVTHQVNQLIEEKLLELVYCIGSAKLSLKDIANKLRLSDNKNIRENYMTPAIQQGYVALLYPDNPTHRNQRYYLTDKGLQALK
jgi:ATP-dependent DNA helicase RecG